MNAERKTNMLRVNGSQQTTAIWMEIVISAHVDVDSLRPACRVSWGMGVTWVDGWVSRVSLYVRQVSSGQVYVDWLRLGGWWVSGFSSYVPVCALFKCQSSAVKKPLLLCNLTYQIITSHVSGRGNVLSPVCVCVCVCVSICLWEAKPLDLWTCTVPEI